MTDPVLLSATMIAPGVWDATYSDGSSSLTMNKPGHWTDEEALAHLRAIAAEEGYRSPDAEWKPNLQGKTSLYWKPTGPDGRPL